MKKLYACLLLLTIQLYSQTYLGVSYKNSDPSNSTNLSSISKITFSGTDINFVLTDNSTTTKALSLIDKMTFSETAGENPLPVELVSFTAAVDGKEVILEWITATEVDNYGFEIERNTHLNPLSGGEAEGRGVWEKIGFAQGYGNSNSPKEYSFIDSPQESPKLNYRLKQIDTDGKYQYSSVIEVELGMLTQYTLKQNFPNPFNPQTQIAYNLPVDGFVTLKVFDIIGREVASLVNEIKKAGRYEVTLDGRGLTSGIYICKMSSANYSSSIKMLMLR